MFLGGRFDYSQMSRNTEIAVGFVLGTIQRLLPEDVEMCAVGGKGV
jgi:hypothetical protein